MAVDDNAVQGTDVVAEHSRHQPVAYPQARGPVSREFPRRPGYTPRRQIRVVTVPSERGFLLVHSSLSSSLSLMVSDSYADPDLGPRVNTSTVVSSIASQACRTPGFSAATSPGP